MLLKLLDFKEVYILRSLVISFNFNKELIVAIYYSDCGYTYSALREVKYILQALKRYKKEKLDIQLGAIKYCENNGGGIFNGYFGDDYNYAVSNFNGIKFKRDGIDKYYGIISITPNGINELRNADNEIILNFDSEKIFSNVIHILDSNEINTDVLYNSKEPPCVFGFDRINRALQDIRVLTRSNKDIFKHGNFIYKIIK